MLIVSCRNCGHGIVVEREARRMWMPTRNGVGSTNYAALKPNSYYVKTCPGCGHIDTYQGRDFKEMPDASAQD